MYATDRVPSERGDDSTGGGAARCPHLSRQQAVCAAEGMPFRGKGIIMANPIRTFAPVAVMPTHVLLDIWYSAKATWRAAQKRRHSARISATCWAGSTCGSTRAPHELAEHLAA